LVQIQIRYEGDLRCASVHGPSGTELSTDAPVDNQGRGESFSPTDLVATALGTCMLTTMGIVAKRHGLKQTGVRNLAGIFLGFRIPKGTKTSNWAAPRLSPQQITYAATDAWACRELYLCFKRLGLV
jgi:organic hydroperoxide reductase OsmC/OhrA